MTDLEFEYLMEVLTDFKGIGRSRASKIINLKDSFLDFNRLTKLDKNQIYSIAGESADGILKALSNIDFDEPARLLSIKKIFKNFLIHQYQLVNELTLEGLSINALLVKALGFTTAEETIEFYVLQRITRSAVTSWGAGPLEQLCLLFGAEKIPAGDNVEVSGKRFDFRKNKEGINYYIQLKSGPNTMNVGMVDSLNSMITKIEEKHPNATGMLGMTYGKNEQISSQIRGGLENFNEKAIIGKEFWDWISDEDDTFIELIQVMDDLSIEYQDIFDKTYLESVKEAQNRLLNEWEIKYGAIGEEGLINFIRVYTD